MRKKTIIRNAVVMTMDDNIGTIPNACVLIDGDRISAVGKNIKDTEAEEVDATNMICMPGFVDTHRHTWATMLRGCSCCGSLDDYLRAPSLHLVPISCQKTATSRRASAKPKQSTADHDRPCVGT